MQKGLKGICDAMLLSDGLQAQPHLRHGPLVDGDDAITCAATLYPHSSSKFTMLASRSSFGKEHSTGTVSSA